jgi:hypothetical protein
MWQDSSHDGDIHSHAGIIQPLGSESCQFIGAFLMSEEEFSCFVVKKSHELSIGAVFLPVKISYYLSVDPTF